MRQTTKLLPIYRQIEEYIKELIEQNQHVPNYKLPSENQLANKFGASRITVQKALNNLQDENIIRRIQGKGTFVNTDDTLSLSSLTRTIYLLLPDIDRKYSRQVIEGANEYLNENNINLAIGMTNNNPELEKAKIESAVKQRALGIILFPVIHQTYHDAFLKLALSNYPIVLVGHMLPGLNFSSVYCDYYQQIHHTVSILIEKGHQHIGYISEVSKNNTTFQHRFQGYKDCLVSHFGIQAVYNIELNFYPEDSQSVAECDIKKAINAFLDGQPEMSALITTNLALEYILEYTNEHPQKKNMQVIVIDEPEYPGIIRNQKVAVINQMPKKIGRIAAEQLLDQIMNNAAPKKITTEYRLDTNQQQFSAY